MNVVDLRPLLAARGTASTPLPRLDDDCLRALAGVERREVQDILDLVAAHLRNRAETLASARRRLDAIISTLIAVTDAIDGDCDLEPSLGASEAYDVLPTNWFRHTVNAADECEDVSEDEGVGEHTAPSHSVLAASARALRPTKIW